MGLITVLSFFVSVVSICLLHNHPFIPGEKEMRVTIGIPIVLSYFLAIASLIGLLVALKRNS